MTSTQTVKSVVPSSRHFLLPVMANVKHFFWESDVSLGKKSAKALRDKLEIREEWNHDRKIGRKFSI
jgi:hypothetical protein